MSSRTLFGNLKNSWKNGKQYESSNTKFIGNLTIYPLKDRKLSNYVNYIKFHRIDANSYQSDRVDDRSYDQIPETDRFICLKIMSYLVVLLFIVAFVSSCVLTSSSKSNNLDNSNGVLNSSKIHIAERYSINRNSKLFYDLSLTADKQTSNKPIYFQFIANKSSHLTSNQVNHHSSLFKNRLPKHANNRHTSRPMVIYQNYLQRYILNNSTAYCNDGTSASYYFRKGKNSKWIIFLEGGWFCYSTFTCYQRWVQMRNFMTSGHWPEVKMVGGILSSRKEENMFYYNANHVYIGYCSSDGWSGNKPAKSNKDLHFSGSLIIENVIKDLVSKGLNDASLVMMSGSSAGASGVLINLDRIANLISSINSKTKVLGLIDSGWFLDNVPFKNMNLNSMLAKKMDDMCLSGGQICSPIESIKKGFNFWNARMPEACQNVYLDEPWRCFFGHRLLSTLRTPIFVMQFLFDEAQMSADNVAIPTTKAHWHYVYKMGLQMRNSLKNVSGIFSPSCISHTMLTTRIWNQIKVNGITLQEAIKCWESKQMNIDKRSNHLNLYQQRRLHSNAITNEVDLISPSLHLNNYHYSNAYSNVFNFRETNSIFNQLLRSDVKSKKVKKNRTKKSNNNNLSSEKCYIRLIDDCTLPQCNTHCPSLKNIFTGKEINFFDLIKAFGVKINTHK